MKEFDVLVVGAGAAGLMAAGTAANRGLRVLLLERNARPGRKLMITGKGRCNVTNACTMLNELIDAAVVNGRFLYGAFSRFMPVDTMEFFESRGVPLKVERGNRVFPESDRAADIVDALDRFARESGAQREQARVTELLLEDACVRGVRTEDGREFFARAVIVATGGASYPLTGSTGDGYALARQAGHGISPPRPSLVPLEAKEGWCREVQGLALKNVALTVRDTGTYSEVYHDLGEMLFTHFGVSGPIVLSASAHMRDIAPEKYVLEIDLKPGLRPERLDARIVRDMTKFASKALGNALQELLPRALIPVLLRQSGLSPDQKANQLTREQRQDLGASLKCLPLTVTGFRPIDEAIVTSGGVEVGGVSPKTLESKRCAGLFFAGEVLDVDAYTGGYNLQIAFSTGALAGNTVCG